MSKEPVTEVKPPYVTYATFNRLIKGFREGVLPARIDRSVMPGTANGVQTYLLSALRFFGLTDDKGIPTADFKALVDPDLGDVAHKAEWKRIVERSYDFIFNSDLDLQRATESQLDDKFRDKGLDGATLRKCHTFFTKAVEEAGIALGPHAKSSTKSSGGGTRSVTPRKKHARRQVTPEALARDGKKPNSGNSMRALLLAKFPDFDPGWSEELKKSWFADFAELKKWGEEEK